MAQQAKSLALHSLPRSTKSHIALLLVDKAIDRSVPLGIFVAEATYDDDTELRGGLSERGYLRSVAQAPTGNAGIAIVGPRYDPLSTAHNIFGFIVGR